MTNSVDKPPPAVGAYWIKEEDYPALLQLFDDGDKMKPGQHRTQKIRRGGGNREIWPTGLTSTVQKLTFP